MAKEGVVEADGVGDPEAVCRIERDAFVTVLNTSQAPANLVSVTLNKLSISGGVLESDETVELGTILPGQTATAKFHISSQRTGAITFSNITTSEDSLVRRLIQGVDASKPLRATYRIYTTDVVLRGSKWSTDS